MSGIDIAPGAPEQLILIPTKSSALKKAQLARILVAGQRGHALGDHLPDRRHVDLLGCLVDALR